MAKLYSNENGYFQTLGEVEEAEFYGDTFNRNSTIAYACAEPATFTANNCVIDKSILDSLKGTCTIGSSAHADGYASVAKGAVSISSKTEELEQRLRDLEAFIRSGVKKTPAPAQVVSTFRDGLKTLHYKREIE
jgi:hypothetical protein